MPDPTAELVPHLTTPTGVADLIEQDATLAAIGDVVAARRAGLKILAGRWLGHPGAKIETAAGSALVTDPKMRGTVVDPDAFLSWALRAQPERCTSRVEVSAEAIRRALDGEHDPGLPIPGSGFPISVRLAEILDEIPGAVTTVPIVDDKLATDLAKPAASREDADGRLWSKATGEEIPGLALRPASEARPHIKPDPDRVADLAGRIVDRLAPLPTLEEAPDA